MMSLDCLVVLLDDVIKQRSDSFGSLIFWKSCFSLIFGYQLDDIYWSIVSFFKYLGMDEEFFFFLVGSSLLNLDGILFLNVLEFFGFIVEGQLVLNLQFVV